MLIQCLKLRDCVLDVSYVRLIPWALQMKYKNRSATNCIVKYPHTHKNDEWDFFIKSESNSSVLFLLKSCDIFWPLCPFWMRFMMADLGLNMKIGSSDVVLGSYESLFDLSNHIDWLCNKKALSVLKKSRTLEQKCERSTCDCINSCDTHSAWTL